MLVIASAEFNMGVAVIQIYPGYLLFVASKIELDRTDSQHPRANGRICRVINPISLSEQRLKPISYLYKIDWSQGEQVEI